MWVNNNIRVRSPYNGWFYWNGVLHIAMLRLHENLNKPQYKDFVVKNYAFAFDHYKLFMEGYTNQNRWSYPFAQMFSNYELDDCGAMGAGLIEAYQIKPREEYLEYINTAADYILTGQVRLPDNTLVRHRPVDLTLWGDDLYMAISFLSRMGKFSGDNKYFDDAIHHLKCSIIIHIILIMDYIIIAGFMIHKKMVWHSGVGAMDGSCLPKLNCWTTFRKITRAGIN